MSTPGIGHNRPPKKTKRRRGRNFVKYRITGFGPNNRLRYEEIIEVATQPDYIKQVTLTSYIDKMLGIPGIVAVKFELKEMSDNADEITCATCGKPTDGGWLCDEHKQTSPERKGEDDADD